jgi:hypothetical protein
MPEIASAIRKLDGNFSIPEVRLNVNDAAFALFFCNDINEQKSLPLFDLRFQGQEPAVDAYGIGFDSVAERTVFRRSSIHSNRYSEIQTFTAPMPPKLLWHSASFENEGFESLRLNPGFE